jgi:O-antigen ligase
MLNRKIGSIILGSLSVGFLLVFTVWRDFRERILYVFNPTSYDETRLWLWKAHLKVFADHPIFGAGYGLNTRKIPEYFNILGAPADTLVSHAHNQFIHLLSATGIIGFSAYVFMQIYFLNLAFWCYRQSQDSFNKVLSLGLFSAMIAFNLGSLTESNFEHAKVRMALLIIWAVTLNQYFQKFNPKKHESK